VAWEKRTRALWGNLWTFFSSRPPEPAGRVLFYDFWTGKWSPVRALTASVLLHVAIFIFPLPHWRDAQAAEARRESERTRLTWFGPARDLPPLSPPAPRRGVAAKRETSAPPGKPTAMHPRQTIVSTPLRANHPRQTLIQPQAPNLPPKILPPLPNIVQWSGPTSPAPRPRPIVEPLDVRRARRTRAQHPAEELPLPAVPNSEARAGDLNIASTLPVNQRPRLPVVPMSVPNPGPRRAGAEVGAAPDIPGAPNSAGATGDGLRNLIALSPDPAPPTPNLAIPLGNLSARFAAAPSLFGAGEEVGGGGSGTDATGTGSRGSGNGEGGGSGGAGPPGISISGGNPENAGRMAGPGSSAPLPSRPLPSRPEPRPLNRARDLRLPSPEPLRVEPRSTPSLGPAYPSAPLEPADAVFGARRIYTLHVNMPNLTSAAGSWILRFAELSPDGESSHEDLVAPSPVRKVDPRYPPVLIEQRIEGEVRLYAIIRADGTVDSVQVLRSVHPDLDRYSIEALVKWRFRPAGRNGKPVDVEAVVSIPFRLSAPF
jgi:TonB family protein